MKDIDVERIVKEGFPVVAVLMARGGWLSGTSIFVGARFEADPEKGLDALWQLDIYSQDGTVLHSVYTKAESIVGISCKRSLPNADQE
jgi:hypothetical protein